MIRESWEERALELGKTLSERMDERFLFAERELDAAKSQVETLSRKVKLADVTLSLIAAQTYVDVALHRDTITAAAKEALSALRTQEKA